MCLGFYIVCCVIGMIGILLNGIIFVVVCKEKCLYIVMYVFIFCFVLVDFVYVLLRVLRDNLQIWYYQRDEFSLNFMRVCDLLSLLGVCLFILYVILLLLLCYVFLVYFLKGYVWFIVIKVKLIFFMIWLLFVVIVLFYFYVVVING